MKHVSPSVRRSVPLARCVLVLAALAAAAPAAAQYQWRDASGKMVFSDQPPPSAVKPGDVIRAESPRPPTAAAATTQSAAPPPTLADREQEYRKRLKEREEAQRKQAEETEKAARLARACEEARGEIRSLESGMRMARVNAQGEREIVGDEERAKRIELLRRDLKDGCKQG